MRVDLLNIIKKFKKLQHNYLRQSINSIFSMPKLYILSVWIITTHFFHNLVKRNNRRREIMAIEKENGETITKEVEVAQEFVRSFQ